MAISAALPITIIYIKFEINFTLFSLRNYVNSCCEAKLHAWILMAFSFKSLWTLKRKTLFLLQTHGDYLIDGKKTDRANIPCSSVMKPNNCPSTHRFCLLCNLMDWTFRSCKDTFKAIWIDYIVFLISNFSDIHNNKAIKPFTIRCSLHQLMGLPMQWQWQFNMLCVWLLLPLSHDSLTALKQHLLPNCSTLTNLPSCSPARVHTRPYPPTPHPHLLGWAFNYLSQTKMYLCGQRVCLPVFVCERYKENGRVKGPQITSQ